ncbi:MAG: hypothetical protein JWO67_1951 [Streptosporangiaceae bacterium]|nr:hypothetical protein [Streptosporangiaceae bacterium]
MSAVTTLSIPSPMNPPVQIELVGAHLPAPCRTALDTLTAAVADRARIRQAYDTAQIPDKGRLAAEATAADAVVNDALQVFAHTTASSSTAIIDAAGAAFTAATDRANTAVRDALDALQEAAQAAILARSVVPGRAIISISTDNRAALDLPVRQHIARLRGELRELLAELPDSVD